MKRPMHMASRIVRCFVLVAAASLAGVVHAGEGVPMPEPSPILGGELVAPCGFPTAVSVGGFCTGTLVHPRVVVYAAHCGDEVPWIRFGDHIEDSFGLEVVPEMCAFNPIGEYGFGTDAAFCRLAEPVEGIPVAPPLMGCEAEAALQVGQAVTVVGFGDSEDTETPYGIKRRLDTTINALSWDEVFIGDFDEGTCYGDSGGPTYVRLDGGEWRSFGITSWGQSGCGYGGYLSTIVHNIDWIETTAGVDITPCHDGLGNWDRGPDCTGFEIDPEPVGGDWESGCEFGAVGGFESTCGDAFDPRIDDLVAPTLAFAKPEAYARYDAKEGATTVIVPVEVTSDDGDGWGVGAIELVILDDDGEELARIPDPTAPFVFDNLAFTNGVWTLRAEAVDRAGNAGVSEELVFGVGEDAPMPPPDPDTSSGDGADPTTSEDDDDTGPAPSDTSSADDDGSSDETSAAASATDDGGCGCTSSPRGGALAHLLVSLVALAAWRRRRSRAAFALALAACGDSSGTDANDSGSSSSGADTTSTTDPTPAESSTTTDAVDSSSESPMPEPDMGVPEPGCGNAIIENDELCDDGNRVDGDGCSAGCIPSGTLISQSLWPEEAPFGTGIDLATSSDGYVVLAQLSPIEGVGVSAAVLGLAADTSVAWSSNAAGATEIDDLYPEALAIDPAGVIVAVGYVLHDTAGTDDVFEPWIARFEPDGALTWSVTEATAPLQYYNDVVIGPSGDPIGVGSRTLDDDTYRLVIRRHAIDDGAMVAEVVDADDAVGSVALSATITADDELLVAGWRTSASGRDLWLGRFDEDGGKIDDTGFGEPLTSYYVDDVAIDDSGDVIICGSVVRAAAQNAIIGHFTLGADDPKVWMERIEPPGPGASGCHGLAIDDQGRIAIGGYAFDADESYQHMFARLSSDGELLWTARLGEHTGYAYDSIEAIVLDAAGDFVAIGQSEDADDQSRVWIGRVTG